MYFLRKSGKVRVYLHRLQHLPSQSGLDTTPPFSLQNTCLLHTRCQTSGTSRSYILYHPAAKWSSRLTFAPTTTRTFTADRVFLLYFFIFETTFFIFFTTAARAFIIRFSLRIFTHICVFDRGIFGILLSITHRVIINFMSDSENFNFAHLGITLIPTLFYYLLVYERATLSWQIF